MKVAENTFDWNRDKDYIKTHLSLDFVDKDEFIQYCLNRVIDDMEETYGPNVDIYGKGFSIYGITNTLGISSKEIEKTKHLHKIKIDCPFCKFIGLPEGHPVTWIKFYKTCPGRCKYYHLVETRLRKPHHFDGQIGDFSEKIVIKAYELEGLYVPSKASIVKEFFSERTKCYITDEDAVDPEKEHFWPSSLGNPYIVYHRDGTYEVNIMKASKLPNKKKDATMPKEYLTAERYEAALKLNNITKIPEFFKDGRNIYSVKLVRKHQDALIKYVTEERRKQDTKLRWIKKFIR
tara:strand:+ start:422 stop:1294 length:873 start_codon:yes stop_codon:yes gene_type:complete